MSTEQQPSAPARTQKRKRSRVKGVYWDEARKIWRAQITVNGQRLSNRARTQDELEEWIRDTRAAAAAQQLTPAEARTTTLAAFVERWQASSHDITPWTMQHYSATLRKHVLPRLGQHVLVDIRPDVLARLYAELRAGGVSVAMVRYTHATLRRVFGTVVQWGLLPVNPCSRVKPPASQREEVEAFSPAETRQILEAAKEERLGALWTLAITSGMRMGELLGLRWPSVDLDRAQITISVQRVRDPIGPAYERQPKTAQSRRTIPLTSLAVDALRAWHRLQRLEGLAKDDHVFTNERLGLPYAGLTMTLYGHYRRLLARAGVPYRKPHAMRHTAATLLLAEGVPIITVSRMLGHASPTITLNTYGHLVPQAQESAVTRLDSLLRQPGAHAPTMHPDGQNTV